MSNNTAELNCKKTSVHGSNQRIISVDLLLTEGNLSFFRQNAKMPAQNFVLETELISFVS